VTRITDVGEPGFEIYVGADARESLVGALESAGAAALDADAAETLRVEAGVPLFHRDMDEETIPLEAGIESRAISFTKGCYVGQEVIIRVLHRGHGRVAKRLVSLAVDGGAVPERSAIIEAGDKTVGHVTSAVFSPRQNQPVALGYVQRDVAEPDTIVRISSSSAGGNASAPISARVTHRIS
jgi:folate-binding protein YgfZ